MAQYQVLARKWRPQQFADVIGQEHITQTLINAIVNKRLAHAYLFVGPRGTGKTTTARILAKALNCEKGPSPTPCDECANCREITEGTGFNVLEFDAASNTQVDKVRELIIENVKYAPSNGKYKIYIVDEVHMLSTSSFNALLKTLEEPPEHVIFVFATTEVAKLPQTILSRCQRFDLRRIPAPLIVQQLSKIAYNEQVEIDEPTLLAIARGCEGCMRDAQSTLDQLISFCGEKITEADVLSMFGLASRTQIVDLVSAVLAGDTATALQLLNSLAEGGKDLQRLLTELMEHFRNLLIVKVGGQASAAGGELDVTEAEMNRLKEQASGADTDALLRILDVFTGSEGRLRFASAKKIFFELTLIKAIKAREALGIDGVLQTLNALRSGTPLPPSTPRIGGTPSISAPAPRPAPVTRPAAAAPAAPAPAPAAPAPTPTPKPAAPPAQQQAEASDLEGMWTDIRGRFAQVASLAKLHLNKGRAVSFDGKIFVIAFDPEFKNAFEAIQSRYASVLKTKIAEVVGQDVIVKMEISADPDIDSKRTSPASTPSLFSSPPPAPAPKAAAPVAPAAPAAEAKPAPVAPVAPPTEKVDIKNDPLIAKALEIFRGQILEVRNPN